MKRTQEGLRISYLFHQDEWDFLVDLHRLDMAVFPLDFDKDLDWRYLGNEDQPVPSEERECGIISELVDFLHPLAEKDRDERWCVRQIVLQNPTDNPDMVSVSNSKDLLYIVRLPEGRIFPRLMSILFEMRMRGCGLLMETDQ